MMLMAENEELWQMLEPLVGRDEEELLLAFSLRPLTVANFRVYLKFIKCFWDGVGAIEHDLLAGAVIAATLPSEPRYMKLQMANRVEDWIRSKNTSKEFSRRRIAIRLICRFLRNDRDYEDSCITPVLISCWEALEKNDIAEEHIYQANTLQSLEEIQRLWLTRAFNLENA